MFSKLVTLAAVFSAVVVEAEVSDSTMENCRYGACCKVNWVDDKSISTTAACTAAGGHVGCCGGSGRRLEMILGELAAVHEVEEADEEDRRRNLYHSTQDRCKTDKDCTNDLFPTCNNGFCREDRRRNVSSSTQGCKCRIGDDDDCNLECPGPLTCQMTSQDELDRLCQGDSGCKKELKMTCQA